MANGFSKEERVAFEDILEGFSDAMVEAKQVAKFGTAAAMMERANDTIWRPQPYIMTSQDRVVGSAVTFQDVEQLAVPATIDYQKNVPWKMTALELRDALQEDRLGKSAKDRLASDVNTAVRDVASLQGTLVVAVSAAAGDYDDIALCEALMDEQGIMPGDRSMLLNPRDYVGMAGNLAARTNMVGKPTTAYEKSFVGDVANFDTFKTGGGKMITAAAGSSLTVATNGAQVQFVPAARSGSANVDNRTQSVTVSSSTGMAAGDCFTIAGINAVHHITKENTSQLKTFRIMSVTNGTTVVISPPMIGANQGSPTDAELAYKNIQVVSTSATAAIVFLNSVSAQANPFWSRESIEILPAGYAIGTGAGLDVIKGTTDQGIEMVMTKSMSNTLVQEYTLDARWGVVNCNPEMNGILLFGQS
jgi:hypothetical protein